MVYASTCFSQAIVSNTRVNFSTINFHMLQAFQFFQIVQHSHFYIARQVSTERESWKISWNRADYETKEIVETT